MTSDFLAAFLTYLTKYPNHYYISLFTVEMSSSWNFPARASPSYEGSEPRHFNFRAETELKFF
jgi:hypothetical protein